MALLEIRQSRYDGVRGRPPIYQNKSWEELPDEVREDFLTDVGDVVTALSACGYILSLPAAKKVVLRFPKKVHYGRIDGR